MLHLGYSSVWLHHACLFVILLNMTLVNAAWVEVLQKVGELSENFTVPEMVTLPFLLCLGY